MRVLVYGISNDIGGISEYMINLSKYIKDIKFDYLIAGKRSYYESLIKNLDGKVYYYTDKKLNLWNNIKDLYYIMKKCRENHDIIYFNTSGIYYIYPYLLALKFKYKIIVHAHNSKDRNINTLYNFLNVLNRKIINKTANIKLTCSDLASEWVFGKKAKSIQINNAIDIEKYKYNSKIRDEIRTKMNIDNKLVIGNVGRLSKAKNQVFLIDIMKEIIKDNKNVILLIIGDGELKRKLIDKVNKLKLEKYVFFMGKCNNVNELMQAMDIFVFPSIHEGFPITLVEAQCSGLPCIVSNNITDMIKITDLVKSLDIKKSPQEWKKVILNNSKYNRINMDKVMRLKGFEQKEISKKVEKLIINMQ